MDKKKAQKILNVYGKPSFKINKINLKFARQTEKDLDEIESKTNEELINNWKDLVWINKIYGQVSLNEIQRISLLELEMEERKIPNEPLKEWYKTEYNKFIKN